MYKKEKVARLFALNWVATMKLKDYHNQNYRKLSKNPNSEAGVIFQTMQLNSSSSFANRKLFKEWFFDMFQYSWDRTFIINYVSSVRNKNVVINPNSLIFDNK